MVNTNNNSPVESGDLSATNANDIKEVNSDKISKMISSISGEVGKDAAYIIIKQVIDCLPMKHVRENELESAVQFLVNIDPRDEMEGMLAAQIIAVHMSSLRMSAISMLDGKTVEVTNSSVNNATKLMRTFVAQMDTLQKYRGKGKQTIQVQHVQVSDGGQAVVGDVNVQGGGDGK